MKEEDLQHLRGMLEDIHQQFITVVREGRGERPRTTASSSPA